VIGFSLGAQVIWIGLRWLENWIKIIFL
jgi:hypothetical protein